MMTVIAETFDGSKLTDGGSNAVLVFAEIVKANNNGETSLDFIHLAERTGLQVHEIWSALTSLETAGMIDNPIGLRLTEEHEIERARRVLERNGLMKELNVGLQYFGDADDYEDMTTDELEVMIYLSDNADRGKFAFDVAEIESHTSLSALQVIHIFASLTIKGRLRFTDYGEVVA
ncbi:MAG TPA: hypothetical protein VGM95_00075 [Lactobacillaceae bacterium]|jgi:predicted Rossmann fold nucleotide-binding protein DprA/Smf involved in DNA uptake